MLQALYNLSDDQAEFQIMDRRTFSRFLGLLDAGDRVPDAKTIWLFREHLTQAGAMDQLFARFDKHLSKSGYLAMGGRMSEATSRANGRRSKSRAHVEHPFARLKGPMNLFVRTIGLARAQVKIGMANLAYNMQCLVWHEGRGVPRDGERGESSRHDAEIGNQH